MKYCEPCRARAGYPAAQVGEAGECQICHQITTVHNVPAMGIPLPGELMNSTQNPFEAPQVDSRAQAIQEQRDQMAAGRGASTSLPPDYEALKKLTQWLAENGWSALQVADAVTRPQDYWKLYRAAMEGGEIAGENQ